MKFKTPLHIPLLQKDVWKTFSKKLLFASKLELFLDYDGTIVKIHKKPMSAVLEPQTIHILRQLAGISDVNVTIVTGRSMNVIKKFVPLKNIRLAANHGFHIYQNKKEWIHPVAISTRKNIHKLVGILQNSLGSIPKVLVEDKEYTLSIHFRNVAPRHVPVMKELAINTVSSFDPNLIITEGKEVLEVRPAVKWGKGFAVKKILNAHKYSHKVLKIYIGDDFTDEGAFKALRPSGITIHVGKSEDTNAQYYVKNVREVYWILKSIIKLRTQQSNKIMNS